MNSSDVPRPGAALPNPLWEIVPDLRDLMDDCDESLRILAATDWDDGDWWRDVAQVVELYAVRSRLRNVSLAVAHVLEGITAAEMLDAAIGEDEEG